MSDLGHLAHGPVTFRACLDEPCPYLLAVRGRSGNAADADRRLDPAGEILEARVEHGPLRLGVGSELGESPAHLALEPGDTALERGHPVVALALEHAGDVGEA